MRTAVPSFVHFSWSFRLIGTYNQFFIPRNQVSHIRISFVSCFFAPQLHTFSLDQAFHSLLPVAPNLSTCLSSLTTCSCFPLPAPHSLDCYWLATLSSDYTSSRARHHLYTPTLLFPKGIHFFLSRVGELCTIHSCFLCCFYPHQPCIPPRCCGSSLPSSINPFTLTGFRAFRLYVNSVLAFFPPCDGEGSFTSRTVFFLLFLIFPAFHIFYHYSRTGYEEKQQCDDSFCLLSAIISFRRKHFNYYFFPTETFKMKFSNHFQLYIE